MLVAGMQINAWLQQQLYCQNVDTLYVSCCWHREHCVNSETRHRSDCRGSTTSHCLLLHENPQSQKYTV